MGAEEVMSHANLHRLCSPGSLRLDGLLISIMHAVIIRMQQSPHLTATLLTSGIFMRCYRYPVAVHYITLAHCGYEQNVTKIIYDDLHNEPTNRHCRQMSVKMFYTNT